MMKKKGIRLNRFLSLCGIASRRKCEECILDERIAVNGVVAAGLFTIVYENDIVSLDGSKITPQRFTYLVMNKPKGVVTTLQDEKNRKHVGMLLPRNLFVKPVGRLDKNTTGVLLFTNDGDLQYRLSHPKYKISRLYQVVLDRIIQENISDKIQKGVLLNHQEVARGNVISIENLKYQSVVRLELKEGLNREIHRLFRVLGYKVIELDRVKYADISAGGLIRGHWRYLHEKEVRVLKKKCGLNY
ncbi:MAG: rRNA pseudouridine synthase [Candidatus Marinimicrobia bacterium]|nr:rRNA pseudouridine synthase [Candidatus Neomarinimicrobiota bacterium]MBL7136243.1 rRNA pseudouridine synthase [Candidatus Neomarinimicrobiota bacterium]